MKNVFLLLGLAMLLQSCEDSSSGGGALVFNSSSSSSSSSAAVPYAYLEVYGSTVSGVTVGEPVLLASCQIDAGTLGGDTPCTATIDEAILYNSRITFKWGTEDTVNCPFIRFTPYYYRASNSATFDPEWADVTNCSIPVTGDDPNCYGGVAPLVISSFSDTNYSFLSYTPSVATGEVSVSQSSGELLRSSNRMISNPPAAYAIGADRSLTNGADGIVNAFGGGYTGPRVTLQHYEVSCEDNFADPLYTLHLYIRDYDVMTPSPGSNSPDNAALNDYPDWDSSDPAIDPN
jgi:hypothetical protein